ncbi:MAG: alpha/beta hydrolase [Thermoanaerobacterales bacterium]|nr:alpha/beta hydrolase [Thermoanaerobacterales bacterium]
MDPRNRYLLTRALAAAATLNALRPVTRFAPHVTTAEFVAGVPVSEMPLQVAALEGGLALLGAGRGRARGWRGLLGLGLTAASIAGLWRLHRDAQDSEEVLERALVEALGPGYRDAIDEPFSPAPAAPVDRSQLLVPRFPRRKRYTASGANIAYGDAGRRNMLDVWKRADLPDDARAPVLLQVHGGAWTVGQKEGQAYPLMSHLAERGWVCVAINYRLSPRATWPDHIVDVKRAIAWTRATIADHGGDPDFIVLTGGSAGGHLTALAALTPGYAPWQPGFEDADTSVAAAVPFYGVYDFLDRHGVANPMLEGLLARAVIKTRLEDDRETWDLASPMSHVRADAPPFFVVHGANDTVVPVEQARYFVSMLREVSTSPVVYAELPRAQHAFDILPSLRTHHTVRAVERFLAVVRSRHGGETPAEAVTSEAT